MNDGNIQIIDVNHECREEWHKFRSPQVPGFYLVACKDDLEEAYLDIPELLGALIEADHGKHVKITAQESYDEYLKSVPKEYHPTVRHYSVGEAA
jgi:hypothetical protein